MLSENDVLMFIFLHVSGLMYFIICMILLSAMQYLLISHAFVDGICLCTFTAGIVSE